MDGVLDYWWVDIVFLWGGVSFFMDVVVVVDFISMGVFNMMVYIYGYVMVSVVRFKEEMYVVYYSDDLVFFFVLEMFGVLYFILD